MPTQNKPVSEHTEDPCTMRILALALRDGPEKGVMFEDWLVDVLPQVPQT